MLLIVLAAGLGAWWGNMTSWASKQLSVKSGNVTLLNTDNWLTGFDTGDPDDQLNFYADAVWYSSGNSSGSGRPPCLRERESVPGRVGYTWVKFPDGSGRAPFVLWVEC